ncbi:MAG: hypothetical protein ACM3O7_02890 [Acidobacteriota bacterium]
MKKVLIFALAAALMGGAAYANFCARDAVPSATLLVPYIVVDMNADGTPNDQGYTTLLAVTNVSASKQLIHVVVYNAWSKGVVDFDEVLSGYDEWLINFRDLVAGRFDLFDTGSPSTGFWTGTVGSIGSPFGPSTNNSAATGRLIDMEDTDYATPSNAGCGFPWGDLSAYAGIIVSGLSSPLDTFSSEDASCFAAGATVPTTGTWLAGLTAAPLFFYATVDTVNVCSGFFPDQDAGYWTPEVPNQNNVLVGNIFYLNNMSNYSESVPAVHIEADTDWMTSESYGFYSHLRLPLTDSSADDREPLGSAFAFNYFNSGGVTTELEVWKNQSDNFLPGGDVSACVRYLYYAFDMNENSKARTINTCPSGLCFGNPEPNVLPFQTQKVAVTAANFDGLMTGDGWMLLVFDPAIPFNYAGSSNDDDVQAWAAAKYNWGTYSTSVEAATLANTYCFTDQVLPALNTYDGSVTHNVR